MTEQSKPEDSVQKLAELLRDGGGNPRAYFETIQIETPLPNTLTTVRWHRICHDATLDQPDSEKLIDKLILLLVDFVCTRKERDEAVAKVVETKSMQAVSALHEKARRLFTSSSKTGEAGELMLYFLAEHLLKYPQILCKFSLKTNPSMHAHGADGVHASVDPDTGHLRLHWGEAKFYGKLGDAIEDCFFSLSEMLLAPTEAKKNKRRDVELIRDFLALNDPDLESAIISYLDPDNILSNKVRYCGMALVGFDLEDYSCFSAEMASKQVNALSSRVRKWERQISKSVTKHRLTQVTADVFCVPFPSVQAFRNAFLKRLS